MKNLFNTFLVLCLFGAMTTFAQEVTKENEYHDKITSNHTTGKKHAQAIMNGESKTTADHKKHADEMDASLKEAKANHAALKTMHKDKHKEAHAAIEKNHADAETHHKALKAELNKPTPDETKVKSHATKYHESINKASEEHEKTK